MRRAGVAKNRSRTTTRVPGGPAAGMTGANSAALDLDGMGMRGARWAGGDVQPGCRTDRGQRLAAEAKGGDVHEVVVRQLGGGVALHRERQFVGVMPAHRR